MEQNILKRYHSIIRYESVFMSEKKTFLEVKDHSVSGEIFQLLHNNELEMLETFPQPDLDKLPYYYKSENYISHTNSKRNLFERVYHFIRAISLKRKLKLINTLESDGKKLLDVGCGTGDFLELSQKHNWEVFGIEPNESARIIANQKTVNKVYDISQLNKFEPKQFDAITLWHVLEHLPNLNEHIQIFKKLLKSNGTLILAVPNYKSFDAKHYKSFWAAYDVPRHLWHFSRTSIYKLVRKFSMGVVKTLPMRFDAYYVSLLSEKYKSGNMNLIKSFWVGLQSNIKAKRSGEYSSLIYIIKNK